MPRTSDEQRPLLGGAPAPQRIICKASILKEAREMVPLAWPVSVGYLLQMSLNMAAVIALGRLGTNALASMALATLYANVTGYSIVVGMGAAIDTLCSQAYGEYLAGTGSKKELGRHLSRAIFIMYILCIPIAILWSFTEPLLLLAGQDPAIAHLSAKYTMMLIPSLIPFVLSECVKRFLMTQGIMSAQMIVIGCVAPINCILQYIFVFTSWRIGDQGAGAPFALTISHTLIAVALVMYTKHIEGGDAYGGWEWNQVLNTRKLWTVLALGTAGVLMTCSEWWAWEIVALVAGLLGPEYLAAQTIVLSATSWAYTMPLGVAIACTTRIGNALGAGCPDRGKLAAFVVLCLGLFLALMNSTLLMLGRNQLGYIFSDDPAVIAIVKQIVPLASAFQIADVLGCICGGILRGVGRPEIGAYLNLIGYYILGIPIGVFFCFQLGWDLFGLWIGLTVALVVVTTVEIYMISLLDWNKESDNAHQRSIDNLECDE
ncbi:hypothetical protein HDU98_011170 [Podochytrium sp. JEL0797]|nr:hypothetical protein HDU98_011170 [Podochytrium sp. JEL0797]